MESSQPVEVTRLLARARAGDAHAMGAAYSAVYDELKRAARLQLRRMHDDFQTTALVHEAYLKLGGAQLAAQDRNHLLALSARAMRQVLVDDARARKADKRGGGQDALTLGALDTAGEPAWPDKSTTSIMAMWQQALIDCASIRHAADDDERLAMTGEASRIEWLLKWQLLEKLRRKITTTSAPGVANGWNDPRLKVIDLKWAALDPADSIFTKLEPRTERVVSAADIARATTEPPEDTRAWLRAKLVAQFGDEVAAASWSRLTVRDPRAADEGEAVEFYGNAGHMAATDHHLFSLDISDPLAFTKAHCETELNSAEHAIDLLKSLAINAER